MLWLRTQTSLKWMHSDTQADPQVSVLGSLLEIPYFQQCDLR